MPLKAPHAATRHHHQVRLLRQQRQLACGNDLSASELAHKYTQPEDYFVWAREFMDVQE